MPGKLKSPAISKYGGLDSKTSLSTQHNLDMLTLGSFDGER